MSSAVFFFFYSMINTFYPIIDQRHLTSISIANKGLSRIMDASIRGLIR